MNISLNCSKCDKIFTKRNAHFLWEKRNNPNYLPCCSFLCRSLLAGGRIEHNCLQCGKQFLKIRTESKRSGKHFCSRSCAGYFNNAHKKYGTRRSKLEKWLEPELIKNYPHLTFNFNKRSVIHFELDIYIPDLKLAFELNGVFHYKPIFGEEKLSKIIKNDLAKQQLCSELGIKLHQIDCSDHTYVKESTCEPFLIEISNIINCHLPCL